MSENILCERYEKNDAIVILSFNKPKKMNALSVEDLMEMDGLIERLHEDKTCRVIVITGKGRSFVAGADISKLEKATKEHSMLYSRWAKKMYENIERGRQTVIAAVNGYALGGGLELAISCDIRVAAESAKLGITETSLGSIPGSCGTLRLPRLIGLGFAKEMLATAEKMSASRAAKIGLVNHVVPDEQLMEFVLELAERIAANSTTAIAVGKKLMTDGIEMDIHRAMELETMMIGANYGGHDQREGMAAFMEKRKPNFE